MKNQDDFLEVQDNGADKTLARIVEHLMDEMKDLKEFIQVARQEIQAVQGDVAGTASVQEELEAVIQASADATNAILDAVELMQTTIDTLPQSYRNAFQQPTTKIFEACTFQDITGQRIQKVMRVLGGVEGKVEKILEVFSKNVGGAERGNFGKCNATHDSIPVVVTNDTDLMNGPQLEKPSQDHIDDLFSKV